MGLVSVILGMEEIIARLDVIYHASTAQEQQGINVLNVGLVRFLIMVDATALLELLEILLQEIVNQTVMHSVRSVIVLVVNV